MPRSPLAIVLAIVVVAAAAASIILYSGRHMHGTGADRNTIVDVRLPVSLSAVARDGKVLFDRTCAACHGENAAGSDSGPPLVHKTYEPNHHGDGSFFRAARAGVRQHHWTFGNMPPQPDVRDVEIAAIVAYVRELQRANGIF